MAVFGKTDILTDHGDYHDDQRKDDQHKKKGSQDHHT